MAPLMPTVLITRNLLAAPNSTLVAASWERVRNSAVHMIFTKFMLRLQYV